MISFSSFPPRPETYENYAAGPRHSDDMMDVDEDDGLGSAKVTCPGESLTSAQDFMRYVVLLPSRH